MKKYLIGLGIVLIFISNNTLYSQKFNYSFHYEGETALINYEKHIFNFNYAYKWNWEFDYKYQEEPDFLKVLIEHPKGKLGRVTFMYSDGFTQNFTLLESEKRYYSSNNKPFFRFTCVKSGVYHTFTLDKNNDGYSWRWGLPREDKDYVIYFAQH